MQTGTITPQELRALLFDIDNQEMTVKELRGLLFNLPSKEYKAPVRFYDMYDIINKLSRETKEIE